MSIQNWNRGPIYGLGELTVTVERVECDNCHEIFENRYGRFCDETDMEVRESEFGFLCNRCYWAAEFNFCHYEAPGMPSLETGPYHLYSEPLDFGYIYS